jgi:hypothetical protein
MRKGLFAGVVYGVCALAEAGIYPAQMPRPSATDGACPDYTTHTLEMQRRMAELGQTNAQTQAILAQTRMVQMYVACRQAGGGDKCGEPPQPFVAQGKTTNYGCVEYEMNQPVAAWPKPTDGQRLAAALNSCTR